MAQTVQFADPETLAIHQETIDYGKELISERNEQGSGLDTVPPAWTPFRAHLFEALDYVAPGAPSECISDDLVVACIIDENCGDRTYLDSEIAIFQICTSISSAYGIKSYMEKREWVRTCWDLTWRSAASLVLIQAPGFPSKTLELPTPINYAVLDHFRVSWIWTEENDDGEHADFVRLEKCNLHSISWWTPRQRQPPARREFLGQQSPFTSPPCSGCGNQSPRVYNEVQLCFNMNCPQFCTSISADSAEKPVSNELTFDEGFLLYRSYVDSAQRPPFPLVRDLLNDLNSLKTSALSHSKMLLRGIVCSRCHAIIPKVYWHVWKCEMCPPDESHDYPYNPGNIDLEAIVPRTFVSYAGHPPLTFHVPKSFGQEIPKLYKDFYAVNRWFLHDGCQLLVLSPTNILNENEKGPNKIFTDALADANSGALGLHRYKEQEAPAVDDHYQSNWGAEYGFYGFQDSLPLQQAPGSVTAAHELLDEISRFEVRNHSTSNAVQVFGFMQDQGLQWHTDGEGELGETQSTLNIGGNSVLRLRLQKAYHNNETAFDEGGEVVRGAKNWEKAVQIKALAAQGKRPTNADLYEFSHGHSNTAQPEARIPLIHGSIVIMQGQTFSKYYEHSWETLGPLTFAVVARTINEEMHQELQDTKYVINSERPNGLLFTSSLDDPGDIDRSPSPDSNPAIPIVVQHVRPRPAAVQRLAYPPQQAQRRSPSAESARSSVSSASEDNRQRLDRLVFLRDTTALSYAEIREQEGWADWKVNAMGSADKRERDRRKRASTYTSPSPSSTPAPGASSSASRRRRAPQPATQASSSGQPWTQAELDQLWDLRNRNPPVSHFQIAAMNGNRRTEKAYREQYAIDKKRRQAQQQSVTNRPATQQRRPTAQQRRATLTATRGRAAQRADTPLQDVPPPLPPLPAIAQPGGFGQGILHQAADGPAEDEDDEADDDDDDDSTSGPVPRSRENR